MLLLGGDCVCLRCLPPRKRARRAAPVIDTVDRSNSSSSSASSAFWTPQRNTVEQPLFLLERLAHIRCYCLTVRGPRAAPLLSAEVRMVDSSVVELLCSYLREPQPQQHSAAAAAAAATAHLCRLRLDVGETLDSRGDDGSAIVCSITDGCAYIRLPLADEPRSRGSHVAADDDRHDLGGGGGGLVGVPSSDGRLSQQLREEAGLYHRAASQRAFERAALADVTLRCRKCAAAAPLVHVRRARALPDVDVSSLVDFMQCCEHTSACAHAPAAPTPAARAALPCVGDGDGAVAFCARVACAHTRAHTHPRTYTPPPHPHTFM